MVKLITGEEKDYSLGLVINEGDSNCSHEFAINGRMDDLYFGSVGKCYKCGRTQVIDDNQALYRETSTCPHTTKKMVFNDGQFYEYCATCANLISQGDISENVVTVKNLNLFKGKYDEQVEGITNTINTKIASLESVISAINTIELKPIAALPDVGEKGIIYLVPQPVSGASSEDIAQPTVSNTCTEYVWLPDENRYEVLGQIAIDLTEYVTNDTLDTKLAEYVKTTVLTATLADYATKSELNDYVKKDDLVYCTSDEIDVIVGGAYGE